MSKKLVNCKACGKEIAKGANKCVHCGKDQRNFLMKHKILTVVLVIIVLVGIGSAFGSGKDKEASSVATASSEKAIDISAKDLAKAYEDNEVKADKDYKDKLANITGKVESIDVMTGQTFVVLSSEKEMGIVNIQCFFSDKGEINKTAELKKGDKITVQGKIDGKSINVAVNDSKIK